MGKQCDHTYYPVLDLDNKPIGQRCSICHEYNESAVQADFGRISKRTTEWAAKELLAALQEGKFLRKLRKSEAIRKIKAQPFFGNVLPKPIGDTVKFRRPTPYNFEKGKSE